MFSWGFIQKNHYEIWEDYFLLPETNELNLEGTIISYNNIHILAHFTVCLVKYNKYVCLRVFKSVQSTLNLNPKSPDQILPQIGWRQSSHTNTCQYFWLEPSAQAWDREGECEAIYRCRRHQIGEFWYINLIDIDHLFSVLERSIKLTFYWTLFYFTKTLHFTLIGLVVVTHRSNQSYHRCTGSTQVRWASG